MSVLADLAAGTPISAGQVVLRISVAAVLASLIGLEREFSEQPAGFRTQLLLGLGAALFTTAGARVFGSDPTRVAAQVVSGIGFLGAGAIVRDGITIRGITTAASIWVSAAVGLASGFGDFLAAGVATAIALLALVGLRGVEKALLPRGRTSQVTVDVTATVPLSEAVAGVRRALGQVTVVGLTTPGPEVYRLRMQARLPAGVDLVELAELLRTSHGVRGVDIRA